MAVVIYRCPNCGGDLRFDPQTQKYKCEYCLSIFGEEEMKPQQVQTEGHEGRERAADGNEAVVYTCPGCGAEIVTDDTTAATFCYYCHNPVVLEGRLSGNYLPDKVLPFKFDRKEAEKRFLEYVHKKKFIPPAFFSKQQIEKLSGVYFPYWVCRYRLDGSMDAKATKIRVYHMGDMEYTETKFYDIVRRGELNFSGISANALKKEERQLAENVQPYCFEEMQDFHMGCLAGFFAEKREVERGELQEQMLSAVKKYAKAAMRDSIRGYQNVSSETVNAEVIEETWEYCLLPVWLLTYHAKNGRLFYYAMNGQTGEVFGELPVSYRKLAVLFTVIFVPVFLIMLAGGYFL